MGVTIHYQGKLTDTSRLPVLVTAIQQAAAQRGWPYTRIDERILGTAEVLVSRELEPPQGLTFNSEYHPVDDRWRGIIVTPPACEPIWLTFGRGGQMITYLPAAGSHAQPGTYLANTSIFTKTQFAGADIHIGVCELLHLCQQHGVELEVMDEGGYWETGDRQQLAKRISFLDAAISKVSQQAAEILNAILGEEVVGDDPRIEIGKNISSPLPDWRRDWGRSAHEN